MKEKEEGKTEDDQAEGGQEEEEIGEIESSEDESNGDIDVEAEAKADAKMEAIVGEEADQSFHKPASQSQDAGDSGEAKIEFELENEIISSPENDEGSKSSSSSDSAQSSDSSSDDKNLASNSDFIVPSIISQDSHTSPIDFMRKRMFSSFTPNFRRSSEPASPKKRHKSEEVFDEIDEIFSSKNL